MLRFIPRLRDVVELLYNNEARKQAGEEVSPKDYKDVYDFLWSQLDGKGMEQFLVFLEKKVKEEENPIDAKAEIVAKLKSIITDRIDKDIEEEANRHNKIMDRLMQQRKLFVFYQ